MPRLPFSALHGFGGTERARWPRSWLSGVSAGIGTGVAASGDKANHDCLPNPCCYFCYLDYYYYYYYFYYYHDYYDYKNYCYCYYRCYFCYASGLPESPLEMGPEWPSPGDIC